MFFRKACSGLAMSVLPLLFQHTGIILVTAPHHFIEYWSGRYAFRIVMSDEEAFILADYLLIISCGVHAVAAIISCGVLTAYYNQGSLSINLSLA